MALGMSLVRYCVPFCRVTTVGEAQPPSARKVATANGRPRYLTFIDKPLFMNLCESTHDWRLATIWLSALGVINRKKVLRPRKKTCNATYPIVFARAGRQLLSVCITSIHLLAARLSCDFQPSGKPSLLPAQLSAGAGMARAALRRCAVT
ncbi:hypothetical protein EMIT0373P_10995 [Pseudomonas chlororaphis]